MNNFIAPSFLCAALLASIAPATASIIDVTNNSQVTVGTNENLLFYISSGNFSFGPGSGYPGEIEMLLGGMPRGGPVASIPGTSGVYMPGILFTGTLQSQDGSVSIPLTNSDATRLGLPSGDLLLTPGSRAGGSYSGPTDVLSAVGTISSQQAATLFASGEGTIDIHNTGTPITFGYAGSPIASDLSASLISTDSWRSMGARISRVEHVTAPEPGTIGLLIIGLTIICTRLVAHARARRYQVEKVRVTAPAHYDA